jgi:hypothetical protein
VKLYFERVCGGKNKCTPTTDEELAFNALLSEELDQRAADKRPPLSHAQVGANLDKLLDQLKMKFVPHNPITL